MVERQPRVPWNGIPGDKTKEETDAERQALMAENRELVFVLGALQTHVRTRC